MVLLKRSIQEILEEFEPFNDHQRALKAELADLHSEYEMLKEFASGEQYMSDYRTASHMRCEIVRLRQELAQRSAEIKQLHEDSGRALRFLPSPSELRERLRQITIETPCNSETVYHVFLSTMDLDVALALCNLARQGVNGEAIVRMADVLAGQREYE